MEQPRCLQDLNVYVEYIQLEMMIQQAQMKTEKYSQDMKLQKEEFVGSKYSL